jgi:glycerol-3-phosphate cytidylyltransferase
MKTVITYGTFDLLHYGHVHLLERAKKLGDYFIVGVTSDAYDKERGKLNVRQSLMERIENVKKLGLADKIIVEEYEGQKILDIQKYHVDVFAIGSDWMGKFDYLREYCQVTYLERTKGISSTQLRIKDNHIIRIGIIGSGRIAKRFVAESKYVSGVNIEGVYNPHLLSAQNFAQYEELEFYTNNLNDFWGRIDAVYIASPHQTHVQYTEAALLSGCHVLCEKPMALYEDECSKVYDLAQKQHLVLMEAIKTAYCPAFQHLLILAKSGRIGQIKDVEATFTKLADIHSREMQANMSGGSVNELGSYALLPMIKLLGHKVEEIHFYSYIQNGVDYFTKGLLRFPHASASFKVGLGAKSEGELIITGTQGYIYVPAPWWKTEYFEMRFEDLRNTNKYFYKFEGEGLRYEIVEFLHQIHKNDGENQYVKREDSQVISNIIGQYNSGKYTVNI